MDSILTSVKKLLGIAEECQEQQKNAGGVWAVCRGDM